MKKCAKCKQEKEITEFTLDKNKPDNLRIYCKDCQKLIRQEQKDRGVPRSKPETAKLYRENNKEKKKNGES